MPNILAHVAVGGVLSRLAIPHVESKWIYAGCLIPDLPWILQRIAWSVDPGIDRYDLRLYATAQASLLGCLVFCAALATLARSPARVFIVLALNSLAHLLLDACQTKWGNGVNLAAPFTWETLNLELFWPESLLTLLLTASGIGFMVVDALRHGVDPIRPGCPSTFRGLCAVLLIAAWLTLPIALARGAYDENTHFVRVLRESGGRAGQPIEMDRVSLEHQSGSSCVTTFAREKILVSGSVPGTDGLVSLKGTFASRGEIQVSELHLHLPGIRDAASTVGLGMILTYWLIGLVTGCKRAL